MTRFDLAGLRVGRGLTQAQLGGRLGVSVAAISKAERKCPQGRVTLLTLSRYLDAMGYELVAEARER